MIVVPLLNSSISILVLRCSCVSFLALNGKYLASVRKFWYGFFLVNEFIWFDAFFFVAKNTQQLAKWLQSYDPHHTHFFKWPSRVIFPIISVRCFGVMQHPRCSSLSAIHLSLNGESASKITIPDPFDRCATNLIAINNCPDKVTT